MNCQNQWCWERKPQWKRGPSLKRTIKGEECMKKNEAVSFKWPRKEEEAMPDLVVRVLKYFWIPAYCYTTKYNISRNYTQEYKQLL